MSGQMDWIWWSLGAMFVLSIGAYLFAELQAFWMRTSVTKIPGGQRFEAHSFSVDMLRRAGKVRVKARNARYSQQAREGQSAMEKSGALDVTFVQAGSPLAQMLALRGQELPIPALIPPEAPTTRPSPGSNPDRPPILK